MAGMSRPGPRLLAIVFFAGVFVGNILHFFVLAPGLRQKIVSKRSNLATLTALPTPSQPAAHLDQRYSDEQWLRLRKFHAARMLRQHGNKSKEGHIYQSNWEPTFSCAFEDRIGKIGVGGKWVCDAYRIAESKVCNVVSVGRNDDWSFEKAMHKLNPRCKIFTFDHTTDGRGCPSFVSFFKIGLGVQDADVDSRGRGPIMSLSKMLKVAGLRNSTVDVFKIDCEGCEWSVWPAFPQAFLGQILIELHGSSDADPFFEAMAANGYVIFHKEPNTIGCKGRCIEYGFLKLAPSFHAQPGRHVSSAKAGNLSEKSAARKPEQQNAGAQEAEWTSPDLNFQDELAERLYLQGERLHRHSNCGFNRHTQKWTLGADKEFDHKNWVQDLLDRECPKIPPSQGCQSEILDTIFCVIGAENRFLSSSALTR
jgi:hypothetical protein